MAFKIHTTDDGRSLPMEYMAASAITPKAGLALVLREGRLEVCGAKARPQYICMTERKEACPEGEVIPVIRVQPDIVFETAFSAEAAAVKVGDKLTLHTDGLSVTAATASGVAEVVSMDGTAAGDTVRVRF